MRMRIWAAGFAALLAMSGAAGCSKKSKSSSTPAPAVDGGVAAGAQPDASAGGGSTTTTTTDPSVNVSTSSIMNLTGSISLTNDSSSSSLRLTEDDTVEGLWIKAMTADITNASSCIDDVDASGAFAMECDGFQGKQLIAAVLEQDADGSYSIVAIITGLGGIGDETSEGELSLTLDPDTGTGSGAFKQYKRDANGELAEVTGVAVDIPAELAALEVVTGTYDFKKTYADNAEEKAALRNGDFSLLPDESTRTSSSWAEQFYVQFSAGSGSTAPRLAVWKDEEKASMCVDGYHVSDGSHALTDFNFDASLNAILTNGWAPQAALDRYYVGQNGDDGAEPGYRFIDQAGRGLVEEFYRRLSEERYRHSPDERYEALKTAYSALVRENSGAGITDETRKAIASAWADFTWDSTLKRQLQLALQKFDTRDLINLNGTGKDFINGKIDDLLTYDQMGHLISIIYGYSYWDASLEQHKDFVAQWEGLTGETTEIDTTLDAIALQLDDADTETQEDGVNEVRSLLQDLSAAQYLVQSACSSSWFIDYSPIFSDSSGKAAFDTLLSKVDLPSSSNSWTATVKDGVTDTARAIFTDFVTVVGPIIGGCGKINLYSSLGWVSQSYKWEQNDAGDWEQIALTDDEKDDNAISALGNISWGLKDAQRRLALFSINIRDPDENGSALIDADGEESETYNEQYAEDDFAALSEGVLALIDSSDWYTYLCWDLSNLGVDLSDSAKCAGYDGYSYSASDNIYLKLFTLQDRVSELVAREAYTSDTDFQEKMRLIAANSSCLPDVWVGWAPTVQDETVTYPFEVRGPVYRIMDAEVTLVPQEDGTAAFFADGSSLQKDFVWDSESGTESQEACVRGEVKKMGYLTFADDGSLKSFTYENGWKDTCYSESSSNDYVSVFFVDSSLADEE